MKKLICLLLCFCLVGCSSVETEYNNDSEDEVTEKSEDTTENETTDPTDSSSVDTTENQTTDSTDSSSGDTSSGSASATAATDITAAQITGNGVTLASASRTVVIDAGHGGNDSGATCGSLNEKDFTLTYALAVGQYLANQGINVIYTRTGDYELYKSSYSYQGVSFYNDLTARAAIPYQYNAAIYCSIHIDSNDASSHGFSCFYNPKYQDSLDLANRILNHLSAIGYTQNRGLLDGTRLRSIRGNTTIAVMAELGFIESSDITYISNNVSTISAAIGDAIIEKLNSGWIEPNITVVPDLS